jgi:hypothetical protein
MTMFTISENITSAATIGGLPYILMCALTLVVHHSRYYEVHNAPRNFKDQMDPYPWTSEQTKDPARPPNFDSIDTILLANLLQ